ncbi:isochorismatase family protein [Bordetella petrii]|uniref:isochorismatase family protein n=1 Tax=Bordetella petrii TaxID=94624 RepID=UPI001E35F422|nr:isochorismatase family protein [Bordetella petrii]MCD0504393.1 isochorismatase family protein [Bordetella petrii]
MLLQAADSTLLIVDMQERLQPAIAHGTETADIAAKLAQGARLLDVPVVATEHASDALGATIEPLRASVQAVFQKRHFSAAREPGFQAWLPPARHTVLVVGWEAHVCVLQTIVGLLELNYRAVLVSDAVGSRRAADQHAGMRRIRASGATVVTAEMALFEWMESCDHPRFRDVLRLVK